MAPADYGSSYRLRHSGISGMRAGLSYLGVHGGFEQGPDIGIGGVEGLHDLIFGYDIRKVQSNTAGKPYRYGLHLELNTIMGEEGTRLQGGTVYQIRPYLMSVTSERNNWYGGIHGIMSFGSLQGSEEDYYYNNSSGQYYERLIEYEYNVSAMGAGVTLGNESRMGNFLIQTQLDIGLLSQSHKLLDEAINTGDLELDPMENSGLVATLGLAFNRSAPPERSQRTYLPASKRPITSPNQAKPSGTYDPFTGQLVTPKKPTPKVQFDPHTGEAVPLVNAPEFDPFTGLPVVVPTTDEPQSPYSLLTHQERSLLIQKNLRLINLNGVSVRATVMDVMDEGILIFRETYGKAGQEILYYNRINSLRFQGARGGFAGGLGGALTGCGVGVGIPLFIALLNSEPDYLVLGFLMAPPAVLGGFLFGAISKETYDLRFTKGPNPLTNGEHQKEILTQMVLMYLDLGFPKYDLVNPGNRVNP